jgi:hypothetical protein
MLRNDVRRFTDVSKVIVEYYEDPEKVTKLIRDNHVIDIKEGLHLFDTEPVERLPSAQMEALPPYTERKDAAGAQHTAAPKATGGG